MKKVLVLFCLALLLGNLIFSPQFFKANTEAEINSLYLEIPKNAWSRAPVKTVYLPVKLGNLSPDGDVLVKSIEILDKDNNLVFEEKKEISLKSVYEYAKSAEEIRESLGINPPTTDDLNIAKEIILEIDKETDKTKKNILVEELWQLLQYKPGDKDPDIYTKKEQQLSNLLPTKWIEIDLTNIKKNIEEEDYIPIKVKINYEINNTAYQAEEQTYLFYLNSLPTRTGWYPGDGHIHTQGLSFDPERDDSPSDYTGNYENYGFSDATDSSTILTRRNQANSFGYKWIIVTDHAGDWSHTHQSRLESNEWSIYNQACTRAMSNYSPNITVCPGEELATKELFESGTQTGHLLCYGNSSYAASYGTCQDLINRTNSAGGFGIIAHPYNIFGTGWSDWNTSGFRGLEIISNQSNYSSSAVGEWDTLLTNNLQGIINGTCPKIIGMANSDVHDSSYKYGSNMNYIYTGSSNPPGTNRTAIYDSLKAGRVSASSDGSLAVFSLNNYAPGSVVNVNPGTNNITIVVTGKCISTAYPYIYVYITSNNGTVVLYDSFYADTDFSKTYQLTASSDCYYRVIVAFKNQYGVVGGYCLVSPAYANLP